LKVAARHIVVHQNLGRVVFDGSDKESEQGRRQRVQEQQQEDEQGDGSGQQTESQLGTPKISQRDEHAVTRLRGAGTEREGLFGGSIP
jgi:hypothetical protein